MPCLVYYTKKSIGTDSERLCDTTMKSHCRTLSFLCLSATQRQACASVLHRDKHVPQCYTETSMCLSATQRQACASVLHRDKHVPQCYTETSMCLSATQRQAQTLRETVVCGIPNCSSLCLILMCLHATHRQAEMLCMRDCGTLQRHKTVVLYA